MHAQQDVDENGPLANTDGLVAIANYKAMPLTPLSKSKSAQPETPASCGCRSSSSRQRTPSKFTAVKNLTASLESQQVAEGDSASVCHPDTANGEDEDACAIPDVNSDVSELSLPKNFSEADEAVEYDSFEDGDDDDDEGPERGGTNGFCTPSSHGLHSTKLHDAGYDENGHKSYLELQRENARLTAELISNKLELAEMSERELCMSKEINMLKQVNNKLASTMAELA